MENSAKINKMSHLWVKALKISGIVISVIIVLILLIPVIFPDKIAEEIRNLANKKLTGKLNFKEANLSFFEHFPSLTLTLTDFSLQGSKPFQNENLVSAKGISLGINLKSLIFNQEVAMDEIYLSNAFINVKVNEKGEANYNVYNSSQTKETDTTSTASLKLSKIEILNSHVKYDDKSTKILVDARGLDYEGKGNLDQSIFDLSTHANIKLFDLTYENAPYLKNKAVNADLVTKINTNSLAFLFAQNNLMINKLPVDFKGRFDFLKNGYLMDFNIKSLNSNLEDVFTALPPAYVTWLKNTQLKGKTDLHFSLKGKYIASENINPDMNLNMKVRNGFVKYSKAPLPVSNLVVNIDTKIPSLDFEKMKVKLDSVFFNVGNDYAKAVINTYGFSTPNIDALLESKINLQTMSKAFGLKNPELKGILNMNMRVKGIYDQAKKKIPATNGTISIKNGFIKSSYYPNPIQNINLNTAVSNSNGTLQDLKISITPASFDFEGNPIYLNAQLENFENIIYDIKAKGELNIGKIYKVFSQKGLELDGYIYADVTLKGSQSDAVSGYYQKLQNSGVLKLRNIKTKSDYLPKPFIIREGIFVFNRDKMNFKDFKASYGQSDFRMNGYMQNAIAFALSQNAVLKGNFTLHSDYINVDEFMTSAENSAVQQTQPTDEVPVNSGVVIIPPNLDLQLIASADKIKFEDLNIENLKGNLKLNQGKMQLKNSGFEMIGCKVNMDLSYFNQSSQKAYFDFGLKAKDFDVKRAYKEVKMFREMASAAANAEGKISLDYKLSGVLDNEMQPIYPSLKGGGTLSVSQVKMKGYKLFNAVSSKTGKDEMKNPDVTNVDIKSKVNNNLIKIDRFKFKVSGFRPRIEGTSSFDGRMNIKMRLGLPPFGIIGIPISVTGTQENPKIKLGKDTEDLNEVEYDGVMPTPADTIPKQQ